MTDTDPVLTALAAVPWLEPIGTVALRGVARNADTAHFVAGETLVAELENGDELYILVQGTAAVSVASGADTRRDLGVLGAGDVCGEMAMLTRALRSATVTALGPVHALRFSRDAMESLLVRHPAIAVHFARVLSQRLDEADEALDELVAPHASGNPSVATDGTAQGAGSAVDRLTGHAAGVLPARPTLSRAWRELVVGHQRDLAFLALTAFVATSLTVRLGATLFIPAGGALFDYLRLAYTAGIAMVCASTAVSLARFRRPVQQAVAVVMGAGLALILNELSVFLAFDTFYLNMTTRDPAMVFNVETLYRRSESEWAVGLMTALLVQLTYLRRFYRRTLFVLASRVRALFIR